MKPKVWLHKNGHIDKVGRGRLSREHIALIEAAVANGEVIEGYSVSKASVATDKPSVKRAAPESGLLNVPDMVRDPSEWVAVFVDSGKPVPTGIKGVCQNCHSSFTYCRCAHPVGRIDHERVGVVRFKPTR